MKKPNLFPLLIIAFFLTFLISCSDDNKSDYEGPGNFDIDGIYYRVLNREYPNIEVEVIKGSKTYSGEINIPTSVTYSGSVLKVARISENAFQSSRITSVNIGDGVKEIGDYAFEECSSLKEIELGSNLKLIKGGAFGFDSDIIHIKCHATEPPECIPEAPILNINGLMVGTMQTFDVYNSAILFVPQESVEKYKTAEVWKNFTTIRPLGDNENPDIYDGPGSFTVEGFTYEVMKRYSPDFSVFLTGIPEGISGKLVIPATVPYNGTEFKVEGISNQYYNDTDQISHIVIPEYFQVIEPRAFSNFKGLESFEVVETNKYLSVYEGVLYDKNLEVMISVPRAKKEISMPLSLNKIGSYAAVWCTELTNLTLPEGVIEIENYGFSNCQNLSTVKLPESLILIGNYSFSDCKSLETIVIPDNVREIGDNGFYGCSGLLKVVLGKGLEKIGGGAFGCMYSLMGDSKINEIISLNPIPPMVVPSYTAPGSPNFPMTVDTFEVYRTATLYVPVDAFEAYKKADVWKVFRHIEPLNE